MSLTARDLDEILAQFERSSFAELKLEVGELKLHVRKAGAAAAPAAPAPAPVAAPAADSPPPLPPLPEVPPLGAGEVDVPAPLLGVFYRAPKPGEPPFVAVGDVVAAETVIGIIEVMKLMNPVRAGVAGRVTAIHAANAALVEYGQPLLRLASA